jgi:hypothetical protein
MKAYSLSQIILLIVFISIIWVVITESRTNLDMFLKEQDCSKKLNKLCFTSGSFDQLMQDEEHPLDNVTNYQNIKHLEFHESEIGNSDNISLLSDVFASLERIDFHSCKFYHSKNDPLRYTVLSLPSTKVGTMDLTQKFGKYIHGGGFIAS